VFPLVIVGKLPGGDIAPTWQRWQRCCSGHAYVTCLLLCM